MHTNTVQGKQYRRLLRVVRPQQLVISVCLGMVLTGVPLLQPYSMPIAQAQTVPSDVRRGFTLLGQGLVNDAIATFRSAIQRYPNSLEAKLGLAIAYRRAGQDDQAWEAYQRVLAQDPNNALALRTVGILGGYRPQWQAQGIEALTTLLRLNPSDGEARAQRALLYGYQGRFAEAIADYEIALQQTPTPAVVLGAAQVYTYSGNYTQGLQLFERYRATGGSIQGASVIAYARALRETGNAAQAVQVLRAELAKSNQLTAATIQIRSELSQAYLDNRQPTEALAVLDPLRGRGDSRLALARALNELGQRQNQPALLTEAAALYRQVLTEKPSQPFTLVRETADVLSGIPQERPYALQLYRQLVQQAPNDRVLVLQQLALENQLGYLSKADLRQRLRTLLQPLPTNSAEQLAIARALIRLDPDPEFLPIYQSLVQAGVSEPFLNFRLAQLLIERNDIAGAQAAVAAYKATSAGANDPAPDLLLAEIDRRQGNLEASAQRYQAILASNTADSDVRSAALRGLAGIRLAQNRPDDALAFYDQLLARNPQDLQVQLGRASVAYRAKRITDAQAEAVLNTWLQNRPVADTPPELYSLVGALPASPQREALYTALITADPTNVPVQLRYVQLLAQRDPNQAQAQVRQLLAQVRASSQGQTDPGVRFLEAQLAQALGNLNQASSAYEAILAQQPENTDALAGLGGVRFQQRRFESAAQLYSQVLSLKPDDRTAQRSLAELEAAQGNPLAALQKLEQIQLQVSAEGGTDADVSRRVQQIQEDFLKQRGFQPPWERY